MDGCNHLISSSKRFLRSTLVTIFLTIFRAISLGIGLLYQRFGHYFDYLFNHFKSDFQTIYSSISLTIFIVTLFKLSFQPSLRSIFEIDTFFSLNFLPLFSFLENVALWEIWCGCLAPKINVEEGVRVCVCECVTVGSSGSQALFHMFMAPLI